jgi:hypothetical protein
LHWFAGSNRPLADSLPLGWRRTNLNEAFVPATIRDTKAATLGQARDTPSS